MQDMATDFTFFRTLSDGRVAFFLRKGWVGVGVGVGEGMGWGDV